MALGAEGPSRASEGPGRVQRLAFGNFGDLRSVGEGVSEMRIHYGPGYRVYFTQRGTTVVILLCSGETSTQDRDIRTAKAMARDLEG
ncbi:MAG: type II toxin-antitoxin system RelE/ParE family toxin [Microvirga sp.]